LGRFYSVARTNDHFGGFMALTLRLQRHGTIHRPYYHIVAMDSRKKARGAVLEKLGHYDPASEPSLVDFKEDRIRHWYATGATVSNTVAVIMKKKNVKLERTRTVTRKPKASSKKS
jgi:small subunit ribosomal protein S16